MGLTKLQGQAAQDLFDRELIVMPCKKKRPWYSGWQKLEQSVDDIRLWNEATCFSILTGKKSQVTVIDVDAPDREWFDKFIEFVTSVQGTKQARKLLEWA